MKLYHYTCSHSVPGIERDGVLKGRPWPFWPQAGPLVHLTDLDWPDRDALGLTSHTLGCDRTEYRVTVDAEAEHWPVFARTLPRAVRFALEDGPGRRPMHWYVGTMPVEVLAIGLTVEVSDA